jgi:hypothetical protein
VLDEDYEQQRLQLLHKHGIDLEDGNGMADGTKTKRMDRKDIERLMGGEGQGGIFTWREKNRRKVVSIISFTPQFVFQFLCIPCFVCVLISESCFDIIQLAYSV